MNHQVPQKEAYLAMHETVRPPISKPDPMKIDSDGLAIHDRIQKRRFPVHFYNAPTVVRLLSQSLPDLDKPKYSDPFRPLSLFEEFGYVLADFLPQALNP